ncbi:MGMT family protein [Taibaiella koreensis]|uniref:MGMT family protein n=1 Tax=Taibaiella koreensis TaxID=1268548 RepID=UPI000E599720|nr:MGMT family protein [Taibaiella koreensis]
MTANSKPDNEEIYKGIFEIVRSIPKGRVTTYGAIAKAMGLTSGARMVARAMGYTMGQKPVVPVQRVVSASGLLNGDEGGGRKKKLEAEGVMVKGNKIVDFSKRFWDPLEELGF